MNPNILDALSTMSDKNFVDLDPIFNANIDEDYDPRCAGITKSSFCNVYHEWIEHCAERMPVSVQSTRDSSLVLLCFALSLLGRRTLGAVSHTTISRYVKRPLFETVFPILKIIFVLVWNFFYTVFTLYSKVISV